MSSSFDSFVRTLTRSGLLDESVIHQALVRLRRRNPQPTAEMLAGQLTSAGLLTEWQVSKLLRGKHKGFFLGKYKLLGLLGRGGMSSVYLADHTLMRRRCAVKVLPWKMVNDSSYLQRFLREAQAVASLDHPNIVRAYDLDRESTGKLELHFLVMEYIEGRNLHELVQQDGPLAPVQAADYLRQGALGLEHAHRAGLVHRDVKPGNFIVDQLGVVKLMDLGLARYHEAEDHSVTLQHDERVLGTADYVAPEQAMNAHGADPRADLYSLGCTLYYLLSGRPPFDAGTLAQRLMAHQTQDPRPLRSFRSDVPEALANLVSRLMQKDPEKRIQTAREVADELQVWLKTPEGAVRSSAMTWPAHRLGDGPDSPPPDSATPGRGIPETNGPQPSSAAGEDALSSFLSRLTDTDSLSLHETSRHKKGSPPPSSIPQAPSSALNPDRPPTSNVVDSFLQSHALAGDSREFSSIINRRSASRIRQRRQNRRWLFAILGMSLCGAGLAVLALRTLESPSLPIASAPERPQETIPAPSTAATPSVGKPIRPVEGAMIQVGSHGHFTTLRGALEFVRQSGAGRRSGGITELQIEGNRVWSEPLVIDNIGLGRLPRGLKIIGSGSPPPILNPPGDDPALIVRDAEQLTIENLVIDCGGRQRGGVVSGFVSGLQLKEIRFTGIATTGLDVQGASGFSNQRFILENCHWNGVSQEACGLLLDGAALGSRNLSVRQCRFLGPLEAAVELRGAAEELVLHQNVFHSVREAIRFRGNDQVLGSVQITSNTIHDYENGFVWGAGITVVGNGLTISNNLFAKGRGGVLRSPGGPADLAWLGEDSVHARYNWSERGEEDSPAGGILFNSNGRTGAAVQFASVDPSSPDFLRPVSEELKKVVTPAGRPVGIGAIAP